MEEWGNLVRQRSYRRLRLLDRYRHGAAGDIATLPWVGELTLPTGETAIGADESPPNGRDLGVVVTDRGFWIRHPDAWEAVPDADIAEFDGPTDKQAIAGLALRRRDGRTASLPVSGADGRF